MLESLRQIDFANLSAANCAFVDTSTLSSLIDDRFLSLLTDPDAARLRSTSLRYGWGVSSTELNQALDLLARFVAYEFVAVDGEMLEISLKSHPEPVEGSPLGAEFLHVTCVPKETYRAAAAAVVDAAAIIRFDPKRERHWFSNRGWWNGAEKNHNDLLFGDLRELRWIRNSNQSLPRALFYTEIARAAKTPLFVTRAKFQQLTAAGQRWIRDGLREVQGATDRAVFNATFEAIRASYDVPYTFEWPPLVRYMLALATQERISVYEAALRLRGMPEAAAFRDWLGQLQRLLMDEATTTSAMHANSLLEELSRTARDWGAHCNSQLGVKFKLATADLKVIPGVSLVLQLFGRGTFSLKDPILNPQVNHLAFISKWYGPIQDRW